jgi:hypothetical protein
MYPKSATTGVLALSLAITSGTGFSVFRGLEGATPPSRPEQATVPSDLKVSLRDGTPVRLRFMAEVSSATAVAGEMAALEVAEDVKAGDTVLIPKGSAAHAIVTLAQAKQRMARGGTLLLELNEIRMRNGEVAPVRGIKRVGGDDPRAAVTTGMIMVGVIVPSAANLLGLVNGDDVVIAKGTEWTVEARGDISVDPLKFGEPTESAPAPADSETQAQPGTGAGADAASSAKPDGAAKTGTGKDAQERLRQLACGPEHVEHQVKTDKSPQTLPEQPTDRALIYVIRPTHYGGLYQTKLAVDGKWVGSNKMNNYFYIKLDPGPHYFCSQSDNHSLLSMIVEAGKTYYLQQRITPGVLKAGSDLELIGDDAGKKGLAKCKRTVFTEKH